MTLSLLSCMGDLHVPERSCSWSPEREDGSQNGNLEPATPVPSSWLPKVTKVWGLFLGSIITEETMNGQSGPYILWQEFCMSPYVVRPPSIFFF